ncbi:hypothetical protein [Bradyrhizobium sp. ERR14]|uniref:hypothetical protein n=1 Tax=Bradyrhizobium sp. ERR14 TaxID=2663837 RepID=UPI001620FE8B|nr:hypothetical protein [Bradyrhizobium sp. ERR14]MBB4396550.1 hypothetical protein [Bradyrhizobium sp. ERR14]
MDSHNSEISNAALPASVQHAVADDQQPNQAEQDAFEQQLDAALVAHPAADRRRQSLAPEAMNSPCP